MKEAFGFVCKAPKASGVRFAITGAWASMAFGEPRYTSDLDFVADLSAESLARFRGQLPSSFHLGEDELPFSVLYPPLAFKFDFFPPAAFPVGPAALDRAAFLENTGLADSALPFVSPEDTLVSKLHFFAMRTGCNETQWRDLTGIVERRGALLDYEYLRCSAARLNLTELLEKALTECADCFSP